MVDKVNLDLELQKYGTILFCDVNNPISWVIVMDNWSSDMTIFEDIISKYVVQEYPYRVVLIKEDDIIKSEQIKIPINV